VDQTSPPKRGAQEREYQYLEGSLVIDTPRSAENVKADRTEERISCLCTDFGDFLELFTARDSVTADRYEDLPPGCGGGVSLATGLITYWVVVIRGRGVPGLGLSALDPEALCCVALHLLEHHVQFVLIHLAQGRRRFSSVAVAEDLWLWLSDGAAFGKDTTGRCALDHRITVDIATE